jgi:hypothetical protein
MALEASTLEAAALAARLQTADERSTYMIAREIMGLANEDECPEGFEFVQLAAIAARVVTLDEETIAAHVTRLAAVSRSLHRLAEAACCRELTAAEDKRDDRLSAEAAKIGAKLGAEKTWTQGDPRGYMVRMLFRRPDGKPISNNMGGEDYGVLAALVAARVGAP